MIQPITVLAVRVGQKPQVETMLPTLEAMQRFVGGLVEKIEWLPDVSLVCNANGRLAGLPFNRMLGYCDVLVGDAFFVRYDDDGNPTSLTDEDVAKLLVLVDEWAIYSPPRRKAGREDE